MYVSLSGFALPMYTTANQPGCH